MARDLEVDRGELDAAVDRFRTALFRLLSARLVERFEENYDEMKDAFFESFHPERGWIRKRRVSFSASWSK